MRLRRLTLPAAVLIALMLVVIYIGVTEWRADDDHQNERAVQDSGNSPEAAEPAASGEPGTLAATRRQLSRHVDELATRAALRRKARSDATPGALDPGSVIELTALPATVEEALAMNPALEKDLACRDEQARLKIDYTLRLIDYVGSCLDGRTRSTGRIGFTLHYDNDPLTRTGTASGLSARGSVLDPADDELVLACVERFQRANPFQSSEKYGGGDERHTSISLDLPLENSHVFKIVREGSYTAGTRFGCEVP